MKTLYRKQTLAAALLAAVTFGVPAVASAQSYNNYNSSRTYVDCKKDDQDNKIVGGVLGAVAGGVLGSQVAGDGARTEGSVLGAAIGAVAGAEIGADRRNCRGEAQADGYYSGQTYGTTYNNTRTYYPTQTHRNGYQTAGHRVPSHARAYGHRDRGYNRHYNHDRSRRAQLFQIEREIQQVRAEIRQLRYDQRYGYSPGRESRIQELGWRLDRLKDQQDRLD